MPYDWTTELPGIYARHADTCTRRDGGVCICGPLGYRAVFDDPSTGERTISPDFGDAAAATAWLSEQRATAPAAAEPEERLPGHDVGSVIDLFLSAAEQGYVLRRPGEAYTFESLRDLRGALSYVDEDLRSLDIQDVRRRHVQALVDELQSTELPPARVLGVVEALRSLYAFAIQRGLVDFSPVVEIGPSFDTSQVGDATAEYAAAAAPPPPLPPPSSGAEWRNPGDAPPLQPTAAMMALGGRVVTWTTRLAIVAFVLVVLVLGRELGVGELIPFR